MSDVVIRAEGLGKKYLIGHRSAERERYTALRDVVARSLMGLGRSGLDIIRGRQIIIGDEVEVFWALKDVNFEIKRGEVVGIVGRNGAGKSTLLKILSRITEPSEGRVEIRGRVASLLEVGTGFHPELTGRENIFLNGAILGMTRSEIRRKFDEIVDFSGVEKFLDTPVKRYSSGMYVRLAFAVAAHLEPEILVVDEVLAVGDAEFQKKCLGKMQDVAGRGRTVLFVSHSMAAIEMLCERAILFEAGMLKYQGSARDVVLSYLRNESAVRFSKKTIANADSKFELLDFRLLSEVGIEVDVVDRKNDVVLEAHFAISSKLTSWRICIRIINESGVVILQSCGTPQPIVPREGSRLIERVAAIRVPKSILKTGSYFVGVSADIPFQEILYLEERVISFEITEKEDLDYLDKTTWPGLVDPVVDWTFRLHDTRP